MRVGDKSLNIGADNNSRGWDPRKMAGPISRDRSRPLGDHRIPRRKDVLPTKTMTPRCLNFSWHFLTIIFAFTQRGVLTQRHGEMFEHMSTNILCCMVSCAMLTPGSTA